MELHSEEKDSWTKQYILRYAGDAVTSLKQKRRVGVKGPGRSYVHEKFMFEYILIQPVSIGGGV